MIPRLTAADVIGALLDDLEATRELLSAALDVLHETTMENRRLKDRVDGFIDEKREEARHTISPRDVFSRLP